MAGLIAIGRTPRGKNFFDALLLRAPIAGPIVKKINLARFTRNLSSMLATDIPIIQTFQVIGRTMSSTHYRRSIDDASQALRSGTSIANADVHNRARDSCREHKLLPCAGWRAVPYDAVDKKIVPGGATATNAG